MSFVRSMLADANVFKRYWWKNSTNGRENISTLETRWTLYFSKGSVTAENPEEPPTPNDVHLLVSTHCAIDYLWCFAWPSGGNMSKPEYPPPPAELELLMADFKTLVQNTPSPATWLKLLMEDFVSWLPLYPRGYRLVTARKRSLQRLCFYRCLCLSTGGGLHGRESMHGRGVCVAVGGMHGRWGCVWQGVFMVGGMCGSGACMAVGTCILADTTRYGQWAGGTHSTGIHSCLLLPSWTLLYCLLHCHAMPPPSLGHTLKCLYFLRYLVIKWDVFLNVNLTQDYPRF